jgi:hypothetical protein
MIIIYIYITRYNNKNMYLKVNIIEKLKIIGKTYTESW